jgi:hypothetical protein
MSSFNDLLSPNVVAPGQDYPSNAQWNALLVELRPQAAILKFRDPNNPQSVTITTTPTLVQFFDQSGFFPEAPNNQLIADSLTATIAVQRTVYSKVVGQPVGMMAIFGIDIIGEVTSGGNRVINIELYADGAPTGLIQQYVVRNGDLILKNSNTAIVLPDGTDLSVFMYTDSATADIDFFLFEFGLSKVALGVANAIITAGDPAPGRFTVRNSSGDPIENSDNEIITT